MRVAEHRVGTLKGHAQEVCGLKWSPWGTQLASGGNDNLLNVWDDRYASSQNTTTDQPLFRLDAHQARMHRHTCMLHVACCMCMHLYTCMHALVPAHERV